MGKIGRQGKKKSNISNLMMVVERLQKRLLISGKKYYSENMKEGHFTVVAEEGDELKRFLVPLNYLKHPSFVRLLEQAAEEYGFHHDGAVMVPCRPTVLERLLAEQW